MAFCINCGQEIEDAKYCIHCGAEQQEKNSSQEYAPLSNYNAQDSTPPPNYNAQGFTPPPPNYNAQGFTPPPNYNSQGFTPPPNYNGQGYPPNSQYQNTNQGFGLYPRGPQNEGLFTAAFVLMIVATVFIGISTFGIGLAWCIPMTIHTNKIKNGTKPNTTGFGVCCLLFVGLIAGILLLASDKEA